jgi:hypothetical protein
MNWPRPTPSFLPPLGGAFFCEARGRRLPTASASHALCRLARTFSALIEALNRSQSEPAITVQNVSISDGGNAIVGNVTQHATVIVKDNAAPSAAMRSGLPDRGTQQREHSTRQRESVHG